MEQTKNDRNNFRVYFDRQSLPLVPNSKKIVRMFIDHGTDEPYKVTLKSNAGYYELRGKVDSQQTRDIVLSMVPSYAKNWLIDTMIIAPKNPEKPVHQFH